jgi:hypothetical protein
VLSALYVVGSVTSNPKRAMASAVRTSAPARDSAHSEQGVYFSVMDSSPRPPGLGSAQPDDMTAPLPLMPDS